MKKLGWVEAEMAEKGYRPKEFLEIAPQKVSLYGCAGAGKAASVVRLSLMP